MIFRGYMCAYSFIYALIFIGVYVGTPYINQQLTVLKFFSGLRIVVTGYQILAGMSYWKAILFLQKEEHRYIPAYDS